MVTHGGPMTIWEALWLSVGSSSFYQAFKDGNIIKKNLGGGWGSKTQKTALAVIAITVLIFSDSSEICRVCSVQSSRIDF